MLAVVASDQYLWKCRQEFSSQTRSMPSNRVAQFQPSIDSRWCGSTSRIVAITSR